MDSVCKGQEFIQCSLHLHITTGLPTAEALYHERDLARSDYPLECFFLSVLHNWCSALPVIPTWQPHRLACISDIPAWMMDQHLQLLLSNTKLLVFSAKQATHLKIKTGSLYLVTTKVAQTTPEPAQLFLPATVMSWLLLHLLPLDCFTPPKNAIWQCRVHRHWTQQSRLFSFVVAQVLPGKGWPSLFSRSSWKPVSFRKTSANTTSPSFYTPILSV